MCRRRLKVKTRMKDFWKWQPSKKTQGRWWWQLPKKTKFPGLKESVADDIHITLRFFWLAATTASIAIGIWWIVAANQELINDPVHVVIKNGKLAARAAYALTIGKLNNVLDAVYQEIEDMKKQSQLSRKGTVQYRGKTWIRNEVKAFSAIVGHMCMPKNRNAVWHPPKKPPVLHDEPEPDFFMDIYDNPTAGSYKEKIIPALKKNVKKCPEMFLACTWNSTPAKCSKIFRERQTNAGGACAFNMIPSSLLRKHKSLKSELENENGIKMEEMDAWKSWDPDTSPFVVTNMTESGRIVTIPKVQQRYGQEYGLSFVIIFETETADTKCFQNEFGGFRLAVHHPLNEPDMRNAGVIIPPNHHVILKITPVIRTAHSNARKVPKDKRECIFTDEQEQLKYNRKYTYENCMAECLLVEVLERCGCANIADSRETGPTARICSTVENQICARNVESDFYTTEKGKCPKCLPSCNSITYQVSTSMIPYSSGSPPPLVQKMLQEHADEAKLENTRPSTSIVSVSIEDAQEIILNVEKKVSLEQEADMFFGILGTMKNFNFYTACKIVLGLLASIVPLKIVFDILMYFILRGVQRYRGVKKMNEAPWIELSKLGLSIAQPQVLDEESLKKMKNMPPLLLEFFKDYQRQVETTKGRSVGRCATAAAGPSGIIGTSGTRRIQSAPSHGYGMEIGEGGIEQPANSTDFVIPILPEEDEGTDLDGIFGDISNFRGGSSGLRRRQVSVTTPPAEGENEMDEGQMPAVPHWGDFIKWYEKRADRDEDAEMNLNDGIWLNMTKIWFSELTEIKMPLRGENTPPLPIFNPNSDNNDPSDLIEPVETLTPHRENNSNLLRRAFRVMWPKKKSNENNSDGENAAEEEGNNGTMISSGGDGMIPEIRLENETHETSSFCCRVSGCRKKKSLSNPSESSGDRISSINVNPVAPTGTGESPEDEIPTTEISFVNYAFLS